MKRRSATQLARRRGCDYSVQSLFYCGWASKFTLPNDNDSIAESVQSTLDSLVARDVAGYFTAPKIRIRRRQHRPTTARMSMPKTAMNEDHPSPTAIGDVRPAWQVGVVQPEAVSELAQ